MDKTALIHKLLDEGKIYFLSRPRRFGKSLLVSTLEYYFKGEKELFQGLAIEKLEKNWETYPVFHIDFNSTDFTDGQALRNKLMAYVSEWEEHYGVVPVTGQGVGDRFAHVLEHIHNTTGKRSVVLIDEYDKPLLDVLDTGYRTKGTNGEDILIEEYNRNILKGFYSTFKAADAHLQFVLLTGVTKFSQVSVFSGFNQPADISMDRRFEALCGITNDEMEEVFHDVMDDMAAEQGVSPQEMREKLRLQYDGYHFGQRLTDIYNPFSLLNCFADNKFNAYWFGSGTPTYLIEMMRKFNCTPTELGEQTEAGRDDFDAATETMTTLTPLLYQSGYVTIKDYDPETELYTLAIPNKEIRVGLFRTLLPHYVSGTNVTGTTTIAKMSKPINEGNIDSALELLRKFLASVPYCNNTDYEGHYQQMMYIMFALLTPYRINVEQHTAKGRTDITLETRNFVYVIELKFGATPQDALQQINRQRYADAFALTGKETVKVGINFEVKDGVMNIDWITE